MLYPHHDEFATRSSSMGLPEKPTPIERFVQLIPLRYPLATLAWVIILGPGSFEIGNLVQNGIPPPYFPNPVNALLGSLLLFYVFYVVRYVRLKVVAAEPSISEVMEGGKQAYYAIFGRVSSTRPIWVLSIILEALAFVSTLPERSFSITSALDLTTQILLIFAFATLIWEYSATNWGLHQLGRSYLKLKSFLEDRFMGAKTMGSLALVLTAAYLVALLLFFLDTATFLPVLSPPFLIFYISLLVLGVTMFFLPLNSIHKRMQTEKLRNQRVLTREFLAIKQLSQTNSTDSLNSSQQTIAKLVRLKDFEITERKLALAPTWPFDIQILAKLITIVLSITAVLLSRFITDFLHIFFANL